MSGISRPVSGSSSITPRLAMSRSLLELREHLARGARAAASICSSSSPRSLAGRGERSFRAARLRPCRTPPPGSGCTATAVSPSIVSGRVVAIVTCVGSPGFGSITGYLKCQKWPFVGFVEDFVVADGRLQERVPVHEPLAAVDFAVLEQLEEPSRGRPGHIGRRA